MAIDAAYIGRYNAIFSKSFTLPHNQQVARGQNGSHSGADRP